MEVVTDWRKVPTPRFQSITKVYGPSGAENGGGGGNTCKPVSLQPIRKRRQNVQLVLSIYAAIFHKADMERVARDQRTTFTCQSRQTD